jgi:hypothetical protein
MVGGNRNDEVMLKPEHFSRREMLGMAAGAAVAAAAPVGSGEPAEFPLYTARELIVNWAGSTANKQPARSTHTSS